MSSQFKMHYVEFTCTYIYVHNSFINSIGRLFFRLAWQKLGDISKEEAMKQFVDIVSNLCPLLQPYVDAHKREKEEQQRKKWVFKLKIYLKVTLATLCLAWICGSLQLGSTLAVTRREEEERLRREAEERERQRLEEEARQKQEQEKQRQLQQEYVQHYLRSIDAMLMAASLWSVLFALLR